jgi:hypothetical protein
MPIKEEDPWRMQYFTDIPCPERVLIPTEDADSYIAYPAYHWVYNKMQICESQGIAHGPHGLHPTHFPVFSKPIYNMRGMGAGSRILRTEREYLVNQYPGHFWMELLTGEHISTDVAIVDGQATWWRHVTAKPLEGGMFDYWTVLADHKPEIESYCSDWLARHFRGYTGMVNLETIGGKIIECHLRFSDQWPDLYGKGWVESLVRLYEHGEWRFDDSQRRTGHSVVLFGGHGLSYKHPDKAVVREILENPAVSSVQITFHEDRPPRSHSMPPGGFRLAIVNCWDLEIGIAAREWLALSFWSTQRLVGRRRKAMADIVARQHAD